MQLPQRVGIMTLPNVILFPQALLPLHIFEARYREMLAHTLEDQRIFAVALCDIDLQPRSIGSVGLIRACVHNPDGTSNLVLQGIARVRFNRIVQKHPYHIAEIEPLTSIATQQNDTEGLASQILERVTQARSKGTMVPDWMMKFLDELKDFDVLADLVAYTFVSDVMTKQSILEEINITKRLERVLEALETQGTNSGFSFE